MPTKLYGGTQTWLNSPSIRIGSIRIRTLNSGSNGMENLFPGSRVSRDFFWTTQVVTYREGGSTNQFISAPGRTDFEPITLCRGVTHDTAFEDWAALVWSYGGNGVALNELRKTVSVTLLNEAGQAVKAFILHRCWPSRYQPIGALDANDTLVAVESITLQYEGFERDPAVVEPQQP